MGKGDIKTKKGKIANGSYGARRRKAASASYVAPVAPKKTATKAAADEEVAKPVAKKAAAVKKPAAKKAVAKK